MSSFRVKSSDGSRNFTVKPGTVINMIDGTTQYLESFAITGMVTILSSDGVMQTLALPGSVIDAVNLSTRVDIDAEEYKPLLPGIRTIAYEHEMMLRARDTAPASSGYNNAPTTTSTSQDSSRPSQSTTTLTTTTTT